MEILTTLDWICHTRAVPSCDIFIQPEVHYIFMSHSLPCVICKMSHDITKTSKTEVEIYAEIMFKVKQLLIAVNIFYYKCVHTVRVQDVTLWAEWNNNSLVPWHRWCVLWADVNRCHKHVRHGRSVQWQMARVAIVVQYCCEIHVVMSHNDCWMYKEACPGLATGTNAYTNSAQ